MGFIVQAICTDCNYQSKPLKIGDGLHSIYSCGNCRAIVNPQRTPFRYNVQRCPNCNVPLTQADWIDASESVLSKSNLEATSDSCPQCKSGKIAYKEIMHFKNMISPEERIPKLNSIIHGRLIANGVIEVPYCPSYYCDFKLANPLPIDAGHQPLQFRVIDIKSSANKKLLVLEYMKLLLDEDLLQAPTDGPPSQPSASEFLKMFEDLLD